MDSCGRLCHETSRPFRSGGSWARNMLKPGSEPKLKVLVFGASLRADSLNRKLAALAAGIVERSGATVIHASMRDFDVPSYDGDVEDGQGIPKGAVELRS